MVLRKGALAGLAVLTLSACGSSHGPWTDPSGNLASSGIIVEYEGFNRCGTQDVVFIEYAGRTYAKDLTGVLGALKGRNGGLLTFSDAARLPLDAVASGYRHNIREVWVAQSDVDGYLYLVYDDQRVERWPRAESPCE
jgi:hypothetical protein